MPTSRKPPCPGSNRKPKATRRSHDGRWKLGLCGECCEEHILTSNGVLRIHRAKEKK